MVEGISNHEHARKWHPGNGGLCMHTIIRDGKRVHLGISTGGHYLSEDGGDTFTAVFAQVVAAGRCRGARGLPSRMIVCMHRPPFPVPLARRDC